MPLTPQQAMMLTSYELRGRFMELAIQVETYLDIYIAEYFSKSRGKQTELSFILLPHINFNTKVQIFDNLLKIRRTSARKRKTFKDGLECVLKYRNIFAHWPVNFSGTAQLKYHKSKVITLAKRRSDGGFEKADPVKMDFYHENRTNEIIQKFNNVINELRELCKFED